MQQTVESEKVEMRENLAKLEQQREQLERDVKEFRAFKEKQEMAQKAVMDDFKKT